MARITKAEQAEIARLVKNATAKRARLIKRGIDVNTLPAIKTPTASLSRAQLNEAKTFLKSFTNRANTRWQYTEDNITKRTANKISAKQRQVNRLLEQRDRRFENEEYKLLSERGATPETKRTVKDDRYSALQGRKFSRAPESFANEKTAQKYLDRLNKFDKEYFKGMDDQWRNNFVSAVQQVQGKRASKHIVEHINAMPIDEWLEIMYTYDIDVEWNYTDGERATAMAELEMYFGYQA